jgi:predicted ArsR family transcriptional regulator
MSTLTYPNHPGAKVGGTSRDAANNMAEHAPTLRERCLDLIALQGDLTTDEAAELLNVSVLAVRPRFSELRALGKIEQTGERRTNASGMTANVWRIKPPMPTVQPDLL